MDYYFINLNGDPERAGKLGVKFALYNPTDNQRYTFPGLLDTGSSANMMPHKVAHKVGVEQYPSHQDTSPGAPATAKIYTIPLEIIELDNITFPIDVGITQDFYPMLMPITNFTKYYNVMLTSTTVTFTDKHPYLVGYNSVGMKAIAQR